MKLKGVGKGISYSMSILGMFFTLTSSQGYAGAMGPISTVSPGKLYIGVFGGGGASTNVSIDQYGTAFFSEVTSIGPLAVNAFGHTDTRGVGIVGGQIGYQWPSILMNSINSLSGITPAVELEGYYMSQSTFTGHDLNSNTAPFEHDFLVSYPLETAVLLANGVVNLDLSSMNRLHPYVGGGIGAAVLSITDAKSLQTAPPEPFNHYNSNTSDKSATFAAQVKAGLNYDVTQNVNIFAEYRWLYIANSDFTFGSTNYPGAHVPTSPWLVDLGSQYYNMGAAGIRFSV